MPTSWRVAVTSQSRSVVSVPRLSRSSSIVPARALLLHSTYFSYFFFLLLSPCPLLFLVPLPLRLLFFVSAIAVFVAIIIKTSSSLPVVLLPHSFSSSSLTFSG